MSLQELTLFGTKNKINIAIKRIQSFEPPEGYYLAFSGGKDSQVIYELTKMAGVKFDANFNLTTIDPPELIHFILDNYPTVNIHKPEISMWALMLKKMSIPTRRSKFCCEYLKERGGIDRLVMTGIRWQESTRRKNNRKMVENCLKYKNKRYLNPIIDWKDNEVWEFINLKKLEYCILYKKGYRRIGCIMCPETTKGMLQDKEYFPKYYEKYLRVFKKIIKYRKSKNKNTFNSAEEMMNWWIYCKPKGNPDQTVIFE